MDYPKYTPLAEYTFGCFYRDGLTPVSTIAVKADSLNVAGQLAHKEIKPSTTQCVRHISTQPNPDYVAEVERRQDVLKQLEVLTLAASARRKACDPCIAGAMGGTDIDFMTLDEKSKRHELLLSLPGSFHEANEAAARTAWRIKSHRARRRVFELLLTHGWSEVPGAAIAQKTFKTIVGDKVAHAYLNSGDSFNRTLSGDYLSEGRNILEPHGVLISHEANDDLLAFQVSLFVKGVDAAISNSYAGRLLAAT